MADYSEMSDEQIDGMTETEAKNILKGVRDREREAKLNKQKEIIRKFFDKKKKKVFCDFD